MAETSLTSLASLTRTMVVWCPDWPVVAAAGETEVGDKPVAVIDKGQVFACSATARLEGVRRGQRTREAQSRCPDLVVLAFDPLVTQRAFEPVIAAIEAIVPGVELIRPGACALRTRGPSRYFGSERQAAEEIARRLRSLDLPDHRLTTPRLGVADGPFAAEQAARATRPDEPVTIVTEGQSARFLSGLPVSVLEQPELAGLLTRLGLTTLGDFASLPSTDVLSRFGPIGAHAHRLAGGGDSRPVVARQPPPELVRWVEFDDPLDRVDQVAFSVRQAADEFVAALAAEGLVCTTVRIEAVAEDGPGSGRRWLHPRWFDAAELVDRVRWQLQGNDTLGKTEVGLTSPIVRVGMIPEEVDSIGAHADALWGNGPDELVHRALSRVQSMLGHGAVVSAVVGGGRGPADRQTLVPWGDRSVPRWSDDAPWIGQLPNPAPSTVFPEPLPAVVVSDEHRVVSIDDRGLLDGQPALFCPTGRPRLVAELLPVDVWAGPWPVSERWWDAEAARKLARFQVVGADGSAWLLVVDRNQWWTVASYD
jgi:protein ImuB